MCSHLRSGYDSVCVPSHRNQSMDIVSRSVHQYVTHNGNKTLKPTLPQIKYKALDHLAPEFF
jgi:hypothetical protein